MYDSEINGMAGYIDRFYLYEQWENYEDAIINSRKLAEAIGHLIIFHAKGVRNSTQKFSYKIKDSEKPIAVIIDGGTYRFYLNRKGNYLMLDALIKAIEGANIINDKEILTSLKILQGWGNKAAHDKPEILTRDDYSKCKPEVENLTRWLFNEYLKLDIPTEISDNLEGKPKILNVFKPLDNHINKYKRLIDNDLLFFTPSENQTIDNICTKLIDSHHVLLLGNPASGKSTLASKISKNIQISHGYQTYYTSFKYDSKHDLWDDIQPLINNKILFIVDDCHLNIQRAANLFRMTHDLNRKACILFISRIIAKDIQENDNIGFNFFEELSELTFSCEKSEAYLREKISGIITQYQLFFENENKREFEIGDINSFIKQIHADLLLLSSYLDVWETEQIALSKIDRALVIKNVYDKYWKNLDVDQSTCLQRYASLYYFEIPFESRYEDKTITDGLLEKGLILKEDSGFCSMYHSSFAELLIDAFYGKNEAIFDRQYRKSKNKREQFLFDRIQEYITSFKEKYGFPGNLHTIIDHLFINPKTRDVSGRNILSQLLQNSENLQAIIDCYCDPRTTLDWADIGHSVYEIKSVDPEKAKDLINKITPWLEEQAKHENLADIGHSVIEFKLVDADKAKDFLNKMETTWLVEKAKHANLADIGHSVIEFKSVDADKAKNFLNKMETTWLVEKAKHANLADIGHSVNEFKSVDADKAKDFLSHIDSVYLYKIASDENFAVISEALGNFYDVDIDKAQKLLEMFSINDLVDIIIQTPYVTFLYRMTIIAQIDPDITHELLLVIDKTYLYQIDQLKKIYYFNRLLFVFHFSEYTEGTCMLIEHAKEHLDQYLSTDDLYQLKPFLELLANYMDIYPIINNEVRRFLGKILNPKNKKSIAAFLGVIHKYHPERAFYYLERFKQKYPENKEVVAFCYYWFGKNNAESKQGDWVGYFKYALEIFKELNHPKGLELTIAELKNLGLL